MEKVFLVEDEVIVREGIKKNIDWEANGYEFCGDARDGELAFPQILKCKPDIVITDIKMPFMDGLELSRLIKKEAPDTEIIVLTGHEEFNFAQEAINIGVVQYLTKPISSEDLLCEVNKVAEKIRTKKQEQELRAKYKLEMAEKQKNEQNSLFKKLVSGESSMSELIEEARKLHLDISAVCYNILLFNVKSKKKEADAYSKTVIALEEKLAEVCKQLGVILFERELEGKAMLFKADSEEELALKQEQMINFLKNSLEVFPAAQYFGGFGEVVFRMTEIAVSFEQAQRAFAHRFFATDNKIVFSDSLSDNAETEDEFNINTFDISHVDKSRINAFLKTGNKDETEFFVAEYATSTGNFMNSLMFRQYIVMDTYFSVVSFVESLNRGRNEIEPLDVNSGVLSNPTDSIAYIERILSQGIAVRESLATNRYKEIVDEVISYIDINYADEELSLNGLAAHVNVSPNHLSMIFSQQTGMPFIKYLTDYRMNKAKEMLRCTNMRSSEIAESVGYHDPHYFSYLFKKTLGMTPTQYRGSNE